MKFIKKHRTKPIILTGLEAAMRRLPYEDGGLQEKYDTIQAGFGGEQQLDKVFENYSFPMNYRVFGDIHLTSSTHFQIDTLFITPSYAIVFEVKNISGELAIIENPPQMIRTSMNGVKTAFSSPVIQVQRNRELLQDWLLARQISLPVYGAVVFAYTKQRVEQANPKIPILFPNAVPTYIRGLPMTQTYLSNDEFEMLSQDLFECHRPFIPSPICTTYPSLREKIIVGVQCPHCEQFRMKKTKSGWQCPMCNGKSADAHKQAIRDWFLLFGGELTNKECREFLCVEKAQTAYRLLMSMGLKTKGANRNRRYMMDFGKREK